LEKKIYSKAKTEDSSLNFDTMTDNKILYAFSFHQTSKQVENIGFFIKQSLEMSRLRLWCLMPLSTIFQLHLYIIAGIFGPLNLFIVY
jgi:hypothetical protein